MNSAIWKSAMTKDVSFALVLAGSLFIATSPAVSQSTFADS